MKPINDFELIHHGCMYSDYFQGCGVCGTEFTDVATGIGDNLTEAIDDCLEQLAERWNVENMETRIVEKYGEIPEVAPPENFDSHHYISIRVR